MTLIIVNFPTTMGFGHTQWLTEVDFVNPSTELVALLSQTFHSVEYLITIFLHSLLYSPIPIAFTSSGPCNITMYGNDM